MEDLKLAAVQSPIRVQIIRSLPSYLWSVTQIRTAPVTVPIKQHPFTVCNAGEKASATIETEHDYKNAVPRRAAFGAGMQFQSGTSRLPSAIAFGLQ